jgi:hypothetical protein
MHLLKASYLPGCFQALSFPHINVDVNGNMCYRKNYEEKAYTKPCIGQREDWQFVKLLDQS